MSAPHAWLASFSLKKRDEDLFHIIVNHPHHFIALSDMMPILDNFGLYILTESADAQNGTYNHTYTCQGLLPGPHFIKTLQHVFEGTLTNDAFNRIVVTTQLTGDQVNVLRAYGCYLQQLSFPYGITAIARTLAGEVELTHMLWQCLEAHFDKNMDATNHVCALNKALRDVHTETENIFQAYLQLFTNTLRLHCRDGGVVFKINARPISFAPHPRPLYESFVYTTRMEGVHLRSGRIARGGIRWSERDDYRTEISELLRAQTLKNSIIVPAGGKGGFICRKWTNLVASGADTATLQAEKAACYEVFIKALLNMVDLHPSETPPYPEDQVDAYFAVAADKGTAEFSDLANQLAKKRGFWLSDAFASGGSNGYNHKNLGITARGTWVSLQHHSKRLKLQSPLSFVGVGDMSGDVFGNGLLYPVKLLAAFNHQHIFIDPNPNIEISLQERRRLFESPQSTWADYNSALISKGGGVFERCHSHITLSPEAAKALDVEHGQYSTHEVIQYILKAQVDVLWLGGIGTYIKGVEESQADVRDRANDDVRVNGEDVRAVIIVEGANLGVTQEGRVAYALKGGAINTDSIDNSAGVDCSDHEVNIKIFFRHIGLPEDEIHTWLENIKHDVADLVLHNNHAQNEALTVMEHESLTFEPIRQYFKKKGIRDGLPRGMQLYQRPLHQWTRPELCYLMAYAKNDLSDRLIQALPHVDLSLFDQDVIAYFPKAMQQHFGANLAGHPLRLPLVATLLSNHIINTWGPMWALPCSPMEEWITHYQWLRTKRTPSREEAPLWHVLLTYLHRKDSAQHAESTYNIIWGNTPNPVWSTLWSGLQPCGDIPAVWDLGALLLACITENSPQICLNNMPSQPKLADWTHFVLSCFDSL